jgi:Cdc6-like AAA superfamily ATPase
MAVETFPSADNLQLSLLAARVFTPGSAINEKDLFAGRINQIRRIVDAVNQTGMHAVLYGEPGVGKTSLSNVCAEFLRGIKTKDIDVIAPKINCVTTDNFSTIWKKVFADVEITKRTQGVGFLAQGTERATSLLDDLPEKITPDLVVRTLDTLGRKFLVVAVIDEFDRIADDAAKREMADTIKMMSDYQARATLLLVGVADSVDELIQEHQSIERALLQIHMPRMVRVELEEIIENGLDRLTMKIDPKALKEIISLAKGLPYFVHLLGLHACRRALDSGEKKIMQKHLQAAIKEALDGAQQTMRSAYHQATASTRKETIHRHVLLACALAKTDDFGYFTASSVVEPISLVRNKPYQLLYFAQHLKDFSDEKRGRILQQTGEPHNRRYRFRNPMMQPFVIMKGLSDRLINAPALEKFGQIKISDASGDGA